MSKTTKNEFKAILNGERFTDKDEFFKRLAELRDSGNFEYSCASSFVTEDDCDEVSDSEFEHSETLNDCEIKLLTPGVVRKLKDRLRSDDLSKAEKLQALMEIDETIEHFREEYDKAVNIREDLKRKYTDIYLEIEDKCRDLKRICEDYTSSLLNSEEILSINRLLIDLKCDIIASFPTDDLVDEETFIKVQDFKSAVKNLYQLIQKFEDLA